MNKQRFVMVGCVVFFLVLVMQSLLRAGNPVVAAENQPLPIKAPAPISAPARTTPVPVHIPAQPAMQPVPQPVPTPPGATAVNSAPTVSGESPTLLPGWLFISILGLFLGLAVRTALRQRADNGRSTNYRTLAKGA